MKMYLAHSTHIDYEAQLYAPLRASVLNSQHVIVLPHEQGNKMKSKDIIRSSDIMFAEVSIPSTSLGIEIGWADAFGVRVVCMHKSDAQPSSSLRYITNDFIEYSDSNDLVEKMSDLISRV